MTNEERSETILEFIEWQFEADDLQASITDIIANVLHFAHENNLDIERALTTGRHHFEEEK